MLCINAKRKMRQRVKLSFMGYYYYIANNAKVYIQMFITQYGPILPLWLVSYPDTE